MDNEFYCSYHQDDKHESYSLKGDILILSNHELLYIYTHSCSHPQHNFRRMFSFASLSIVPCHNHKGEAFSCNLTSYVHIHRSLEGE